MGDIYEFTGGTVGNLASSVAIDILKSAFSDEELFSEENAIALLEGATIGAFFDGIMFTLSKVTMGTLRKIWHVFTDPFAFLKRLKMKQK